MKPILSRIVVSAVALVPAVAAFSDVSSREELVACARPVETTDPTFPELVDEALDRIFLRVIDCWGLPGPLGPFYTPKQTKFLKALGAVREANAQGKVLEGDLVDSEGNDGPTGETGAERLDENGNPVSTAAVGAGDEVVTIDTDDILPGRSLDADYQTFQATLIHEGTAIAGKHGRRRLGHA